MKEFPEEAELKPAAKEYIIKSFADLLAAFEKERKRRGWNYQNVMDRHKDVANTNLLSNMARAVRDVRLSTATTLAKALEMELVLRRKPRVTQKAAMFDSIRAQVDKNVDAE